MPFTGAMSDYLETGLLAHVLTNEAFSSPGAVYLALFTGSDAVTNLETNDLVSNEVANAGAYARTLASFGSPTLVGGLASSEVTGTVSFPQANAAWGTITGWAVTDSSTHNAGNVLYFGPFDTAKAINSGDTAEINSGDLSIEHR